jgi:quinoprotein glucose dehydrogenase
VDPEGVLYVNANEMPWILTMLKAEGGAGAAANPQALFRMLCAPCHGLNWEGNPTQNVPALTNVTGRFTREQLVQHIRTGKGAMPSFAFLSEEQKGLLADMILGIEPDRSDHHAAAPPTGLDRVPYTHGGYRRWQDTNGYPVIKPPWGTLNAIDLNTGEYRWRVPLGEYEELAARGIPKTGTENYGGPVVTAGGLIFIAATRDECIRAFDKDTGEELWKARLPAGGYATPATYMVHGRQYVVIACGGGKMATKSSDSYVAFALPE